MWTSLQIALNFVHEFIVEPAYTNPFSCIDVSLQVALMLDILHTINILVSMFSYLHNAKTQSLKSQNKRSTERTISFPVKGFGEGRLDRLLHIVCQQKLGMP